MSTEAPTISSVTRPATDSLASFLSELLLEQQRLHTPVARFAALHEQGLATSATTPLIPLSAPSPGEQYAFEVDLDACSGCKACVAACHSLNGLDDTEAWRDVGLIHGGSVGAPYQQTITSACHHCADPGCLNGCPVVAYEKDPATGIVRHLDDQCIGCSYCVLKCPYDVPKYNERLGIVRKCDMCHQRLAVGEAPACAQACPTHAIRIVTVSTSSAHHRFLAAAPEPNYTKPTTRYASARPIPSNASAADSGALLVQHAHFPLVVMLVLTQLGAGLLTTCPLTTLTLSSHKPGAYLGYYFQNASAHGIQLLGLALFFTGMGASILHLGQPLRAWRFFLGLKTSWLSREILAFSILAPVVLATLIWPASAILRDALAFFGSMAISCSVMIYVDTRRRFWAAPFTFARFFGTAFIAAMYPSTFAMAASLCAKLALETFQVMDTSTSARIQRGPLKGLLATRLVLAASSVTTLACGRPVFGFILLALGELLERVLFFKSVDASKMPGHPAAS